MALITLGIQSVHLSFILTIKLLKSEERKGISTYSLIELLEVYRIIVEGLPK